MADLQMKVIANPNFKDARTIEVSIISGKTYTINLPRQQTNIKVKDIKELISKQAKIPSFIQELFHEGLSLKDDEVFQSDWKKLVIALAPTPEFELLVYMYRFYKVKVRKEWTLREVKERLELKTSIPASSIYLFKESEIVRPLYAIMPEDDTMLCSLDIITSDTKLVGLRMLDLGDSMKAPIMNKNDTVGNLLSRIKPEKKVNKLEYEDKAQYGDISKKDLLLELKSYSIKCN